MRLNALPGVRATVTPLPGQQPPRVHLTLGPFVFGLEPDEALALADRLVDAVETIRNHANGRTDRRMTDPTTAAAPADLVFLDTETLGLDPTAPVWEFAAIRRAADGTTTERQCFIDHRPAGWLDEMPERFAADYRTRFDPAAALDEAEAAAEVHRITAGAHVVGAVPSFDTERLAQLLRRNGIEPAWHYHLIDVENVIVGWLAHFGRLHPPPWKSDDLSLAVGVDPARFARYTARGDVLWTIAQFDAVMTHPHGRTDSP